MPDKKLTKPDENVSPYYVGQPGLTKREYFAAMAMQGILADHDFRGYVEEMAVRVADNLIAELNK